MRYSIHPADTIEITILVDNYSDLLLGENTPPVYRPVLPDGQTLLAEHGLSFLIRISSEGKKHSLLMDAGASEIALLQNAERLGLNRDEIEEIVISHGHFDHIGALNHILRSSPHRIPVHLHPAAFARRRKKYPDGTYTDLPTLNRDGITHDGAILSMSAGSSLIMNQYALLTGEIERQTSYEQGSPNLEAEADGRFVIDPFCDDQSLILHLKDRGLVIISGCAHAGIINSVRYAQKITGIDQIHAIIGGFHLSGPYFRTIIPQTITDLQEIDPRYIIPVHCTGWEAQTAIARTMPERFLLSTVGTRFHFEA